MIDQGESLPHRLPFAAINLVGDFRVRCMTMAWPCEVVQGFLPYGTSLGPQQLTPRGTHPVMLFFYDFFQVHMTIPNPLPTMTYNEHVLGVPHVMVNNGDGWGRDAGPFFVMPRLLLDNIWAILGGLVYWGYPKRLSRIAVTGDRFAVSDLAGSPQLALEFHGHGELLPIQHYPHFAPVREVLDQPMLTQLPLGMGPMLVCSRYDKHWPSVTLRPLAAAVTIDQAFIPGLPCGRFPGRGWSAGIDQSPLGSYELRAHFRQTIPYPWSMHSLLQHPR